MLTKRIIKLIIFTTFLSLSIYAQDKITIGTIDLEPKEKIYKFQAVADYLQEKLKQKNIKVDVEIAKNLDTVIKLISDNKLDIFIDSVYPTLLVQKKSDITIECKRWKKGIEGYRSVIFVKKNSNINSIEDLKGKTIAFEDEFSTSSFFIPKKAIEKKGLKVSKKGEKESVNYDYARSEKNTAAWVLYSKVDAGATDDKTFESFDKNMFKIIYTSKLIPRHLVSFSKRINPKLKKEILDILYDMDKSRVGKETLKKFSKTKKFSPLTNDDMKIIQGL
ncbi:MAG: phosphate/phosphite/phosphonate ABC transporter substrate-binding protein [Arcobacteraceae bacterium]|nr:phosphate/phosphite/phosphonate ABC transporter substrate-binding protein [Arcobacteraceae bacterium]